MARLVVRSESGEETVFPIQTETIKLGRGPDNDLILEDLAASRTHGEVRSRGGRHYVADLDSSHGTHVNGVRVTVELLLNDNDVIQIGNTQIFYHNPPEVAPPAKSTDDTDAPISTHTFSFATSDVAASAGLGSDTIALSVPAEPSSASQGMSKNHLDMLSKTAVAIQSIFDLSELLGVLMDMIFEIFKPERGVVFLQETDEGGLKPKIVRPAGPPFEISQTILEHAVTNRVSLLVSDAAKDDRFSGAHSVMFQSIRSAICSPLVSKEKVLGALYIDTKVHQIQYTEEDLALLNIIAANAAIAIENAALVEEKLKGERLAGIGLAVAGMAHYAKNILSGIMGSTSLIDQSLKNDKFDIVKKIWPVQKRANGRIIVLIQDMLSYSKEREPEWERLSINAVVGDVYENQAARAAEFDVALELDVDPNLPESYFDPKAILDAVLNLAGNAIEACQPVDGAQVTLSSRFLPAEKMIRIVIADNGPGIPEEIQSKIFDPFFSTKGSKGTGFGLAVARKTIEEHGGTIELRSAEGKGTTFEITIPSRQTPPPPVSQM